MRNEPFVAASIQLTRRIRSSVAGAGSTPGEFGALYLNATVRVAAANARAQHSGRAIKLFDLLPEARPEQPGFTSTGEELALFEGIRAGSSQKRRRFHEWYADPIAG